MDEVVFVLIQHPQTRSFRQLSIRISFSSSKIKNIIRNKDFRTSAFICLMVLSVSWERGDQNNLFTLLDLSPSERSIWMFWAVFSRFALILWSWKSCLTNCKIFKIQGCNTQGLPPTLLLRIFLLNKVVKKDHYRRFDLNALILSKIKLKLKI